MCDLDAAVPGDLTAAALLSASPSPIRRVAMLVTTLLAEAEAAVLAACHACAAAAQFTVLCAASEAAHHDELPAAYGPHCYASIHAAWQAQLNAARLAAGTGPCSLAVLHCPLPLCPLSSAAFVLPSGSAAAALPRVGPLPAGYATSAAAATGNDSDDEQQAQQQQQQQQLGSRPGSRRSGSAAGSASGARSSSASCPPSSGLSLLAHALVDITAALGYPPEAFSLGPCSALVARQMAFVPAPAGDAPPAALVIIDRLLDPVSPGLHPDLLVPRMFDALQLRSSGSGGGGAADEAAAVREEAGWPRGSLFAPAATQLRMPGLDPPLAAASIGQPQPEAGSSSNTSYAGPERGPWSLLPGSLQHVGDAQVGCETLATLPACCTTSLPAFPFLWGFNARRQESRHQAASFQPASTYLPADCFATSSCATGRALAGVPAEPQGQGRPTVHPQVATRGSPQGGAARKVGLPVGMACPALLASTLCAAGRLMTKTSTWLDLCVLALPLSPVISPLPGIPSALEGSPMQRAQQDQHTQPVPKWAPHLLAFTMPPVCRRTRRSCSASSLAAASALRGFVAWQTRCGGSRPPRRAATRRCCSLPRRRRRRWRDSTPVSPSWRLGRQRMQGFLIQSQQCPPAPWNCSRRCCLPTRSMASRMAPGPCATSSFCFPQPHTLRNSSAPGPSAPAERWEALQREERHLLFACAESSKAAAAHLADLCRLAGQQGGPLGLPDVEQLLLAAHCWLPAFLPW